MSYAFWLNARNNKLKAAYKAGKKECIELLNILEKYPNEQKEIVNDIVDLWYDSYKKRTTDFTPSGSLKNSYIFGEDNGEEIPDPIVDPTLGGVKHHQNHPKNTNNPNEIIYNNAFLLGYHGGSTGKRLNESEPHYRSGKGYRRWGRKAIKTFSPKDEIEKAFKEYDIETQKIIDEKCIKLNEIIDTIYALKREQYPH